MQLVIWVRTQNVVRSLVVKTLYIAPPALLPSEAEADTTAVGVVENPLNDLWKAQHATVSRNAGAATRRQHTGERAETPSSTRQCERQLRPSLEYITSQAAAIPCRAQAQRLALQPSQGVRFV